MHFYGSSWGTGEWIGVHGCGLVVDVGWFCLLVSWKTVKGKGEFVISVVLLSFFGEASKIDVLFSLHPSRLDNSLLGTDGVDWVRPKKKGGGEVLTLSRQFSKSISQ